MFLKNFTIYTEHWDKSIVDEYFTIFPKNLPTYYKTIPTKYFDPGISKFLESHRTVKTRSGFMNLYKRSMLVSSPCDIEIVVDKDRRAMSFVGKYGNKHNFVHQHSIAQHAQYVPSSVNLDFTLKFTFGWYLDCKKESVVIHSPSWHFPKFQVVPGIIGGHEELNFFMNVYKDQDHIIIKQNDPLFLVTPCTNKSFKFKIKNRKKAEFERRKGDLVFTNFKKFVKESVFKKD